MVDPKPATAKPTPRPRGPVRAAGRSLVEFGKLGPAEKDLLACVRRGEVAVVGDERPDSVSGTNSIRADFIRFLALGGDEQSPVHERGVKLQGAWIVGILDLDGVRTGAQLILTRCRFEAILARHADLKLLSLDGSLLEGGLSADGLRCERGVFMRAGFEAREKVRMVGASIGANFDCSGGMFASEKYEALNLDGATISGNVFLRNGFKASGEVRLMGATIARQLYCGRGSFRNASGYALSCDRAQVGGIWFFRDIEAIEGIVDLSSSRAAELADDAASWEMARGVSVLDGFTYDRFVGGAPTDASWRIAWLEMQAETYLDADFRPQPWEQLIRVLRDMGLPDEARSVAIAKQERFRKAGRLARGARPFHWMYGALVGYGYRPMRLVTVTVAVWLSCAAAYWWATNPGGLGPATHLLAAADRSDGRPRADYGNFVPLVYSADVLLPVVDLGYKEEWQPVVSKDGKQLIAGQLLRFLYWFEIAFGWVAGLLLVGVLGNLIKKD